MIGPMARPVLVFNAVPHVVLAVARSLSRRGIPVIFSDVSGRRSCPPSRAIRDAVLLPNHRKAPDHFIEVLSHVIVSKGCDMLVPSSDPGLVAVSEHYDRLASLLRVGCPPPDVVKRVLDKRRTLDTAAACGILIPTTRSISDAKMLESIGSDLRFPMIAKPLTKENEFLHTFKMRYFATLQDLKDAFTTEPQFGMRNLLQEFCGGEGVGIEVLLHKREPLALFQHCRRKQLPVTGGGSVTSVSEELDPDLVDQALTLLRKLEWEGVAMVEFKYERASRRAVLMEVNGRYWGSLPLAIGAGVDFPFYEWQLAHGERPKVPKVYRVGLRYHWLAGDIRRLGSLFDGSPKHGFPLPSRGREVIQFFKDFVTPSLSATWSWSDPKPALWEIRAAIKSTTGALLRRATRKSKHAVAIYRYQGWRNSIVYLKLRALYALGLKQACRPLDIQSVRSILILCHGNKLRSPLVEALLRKYLAGSANTARLSVCSAGLIDHPEERADERGRIVAREFGVSLDDHKPRRVTPKLLEEADVIFIMDHLNEARIRVSYPNVTGKTFYLGAYSPGLQNSRCIEVFDPDRGTLADIRRCYRQLDLLARTLVQVLRGGQSEQQMPHQPVGSPGSPQKQDQT